MKASELRINNYLYNDGVVVKIDARTIFDIWDDKGLKNYKPIPLTEEWLLKFGFEKIENNWKCLDLHFAIISWERLAGLTLSFEKESIYMPHIKHVHQLQNLVHALTNEELTYEQQK